LILLDSSLSEAVEYLASFAWPLGLWFASIFIGLGFAWPRLRGPIFSKPIYRLLCLASLLIPMIAIQHRRYGDTVGSANQYFRDCFPWSAIAGRLQAGDELSTFSAMQRDLNSANNVAVKRISAGRMPRTVVLVIGESARRDRHSIYGYGQATTPFAEKADGLLAFANAVTLYPQTVDAVPVILAKRDRASSEVPLPSLVKLFSNAGYHTAWISNQAALGADDSPVSIYAGQADYRSFARTLSRYGSIPLDESLLPRFREQLAGKPVDRFIVLHLFGSHEEFSRRYPHEYALLPDPYDNSIRYTDSILNTIHNELAAMPGENALVYVADHGLKLGECDGRSEHFDAKGSYEVPLYIWTSPSWRQNHAEQWTAAVSHTDFPVTTMSVVDTLMDLADLRYSQYDPGLSLLSEKLHPSKRLVHTFSGTVDYDQASNDARCHLIANAQPLTNNGVRSDRP
jgi:heptose-I-phosphate ethanolaminephosphotransferase